MIDCMRIGKLFQSDFDKIVASAGGHRFSEDDSQEEEENCDYIFGSAAMELKIIEERGRV